MTSVTPTFVIFPVIQRKSHFLYSPLIILNVIRYGELNNVLDNKGQKLSHVINSQVVVLFGQFIVPVKIRVCFSCDLFFFVCFALCFHENKMLFSVCSVFSLSFPLFSLLLNN